jgi:hypothetical protein
MRQTPRTSEYARLRYHALLGAAEALGRLHLSRAQYPDVTDQEIDAALVALRPILNAYDHHTGV